MVEDSAPPLVLVGRYRLGALLGQGANGAVFCAEDLGRGARQVALKLTRSVTEGEAFRSPAAEILQDFYHPNWAEILDAGTIPAKEAEQVPHAGPRREGKAWFQVQRLIRGTSLDHLEGPQDPELVWRLLEDGARVLRALHDRGIIHYDVTPSNLLLEQRSDGLHFTLTDGSLAHLGPIEGSAAGTPLFMAPEVTESLGHDNRADLYSLGLVAYYLLTGRNALAEDGDEITDIVDKRRNQDVPGPATLRPDVPPELDTLLRELLARDRAARPGSGRDVLRRIAELRGKDVPELLQSEAYAHVQSGPMVGNEEILERGRKAFEDLARQLGSNSGVDSRRADDCVILLEGAPGAGTTRVTRELVRLARAHELPVVLLAGKDGAPDPEAPLDLVFESMRSLAAAGRPPGESHPGSASFHSGSVEELIDACVRTSATTPYLFVVEDMPSLPEATRRALSALTRELLSRLEHDATALPPPLAVCLDLRPDDTPSFLIPDAEHPRAPVSQVRMMRESELHRVVQDRLDTRTIEPDDLNPLSAHTNGAAGRVIPLLCRLGLRHFGSTPRESLHAHLASLDGLDLTPSQLLPGVLASLAAAPDALLHLLDCVAIADRGLPESVMHELCRSFGLSGLPATDLLACKRSAHGVIYDLEPPALRIHLRASTAERQQAEPKLALLRALRKAPTDRTFDLRLRLARELEGADAAWHELEQASPAHMRRSSLHVQEEVEKLVQLSPSGLDRPQRRALVASFLAPNATGIRLARHIAPQLPTDGSEARTALAIAEIFAETTSTTEEVDAFLRTQLDACRGDPVDCARLAAMHAKVLLNAKRFKPAARSARYGRRLLRDSISKTGDYALAHAEVCSVCARVVLRRNETELAIKLLNVGAAQAERCGNEVMEAYLQNNIGILQFSEGRFTEAKLSFERSAELKARARDYPGLIRTKLNLSRVYRESPQDASLEEATKIARECVDLSQRHGLLHTLEASLDELAGAYDELYRADLALDTYLRAWRSSVRLEAAPAFHVAWKLAPLAAALGRVTLAFDVLKRTASSVRSSRASDAGTARRAIHYVTAALVAQHVGNVKRRSYAIARAQRHAEDLPRSARFVLTVLDWLASLEAATATGFPQQDTPGHSPAAQRLNRVLRWVATEGSHSSDRSIDHPQTRASSPPGLPAGESGRLGAEALLALAHYGPSWVSGRLTSSVLSYCRTSGLRLLRARAQAIAVARAQALSPSTLAVYFSSVVALLDECTKLSGAATMPVPREVSAAAQVVSSRLGQSTGSPGSYQGLHVLAHKALVHFGAVLQSDGRHALAIRRALDASKQLQLGGSSVTLFSDITRHIIEITGAHRACVVLLEDDKLRVVASSWTESPQQDVKLSKVSSTVISKVRERRTALLWHPTGAPGDSDYAEGLSSGDMDEASTATQPLLLRSILCVPMLRGSVLYGVLYAENTETAMAFSRIDLDVLALFAEQAAAAIEAQQLLERVQASLENVRSLQERLMAGERLRVMGEVSSGVAHEFNNLLMAIEARLQILGLTALPKEVLREVDLIRKTTGDAAEVVRRLRSFSRRQRQADFEVIDLREVCQDALAMLAPLWRQRSGPHSRVEVRFRSCDSASVRGSPTELREVLTNLVKNALEAVGPEGIVTVDIEHRNGNAIVHVRDTGPGIPEDLRDRVFEEFYTTKGSAGTGLGLCLSRQIVVRHGGRIGVEANASGGAAFWFAIPLVEAKVKRRVRAGHGRPRRRADTNYSVLVVDDEDAVRTSIVTYLERVGRDVRSAADGKAAVQLLQAWTPDVVLSDVGMPGMDGIELCALLQRQAGSPPVVLMSGLAEDAGDRAEAACARHLLSKPIVMRDLDELLGKVALEARDQR